MPIDINLIDDPIAAHPQIVEIVPPSGQLRFRSHPFNGQPALAFHVIFESGFDGKFSTAKPLTRGKLTVQGVEFHSQPDGPYWEVSINLLKSEPLQKIGYKYKILMNGKVLDPRVIPE
jgi:hypothetical protein